MKYLLTFVLAGFLGTPLWATDPVEPPLIPIIRPAENVDLNEFLWINRPVIVFADSPADPSFIEQIELFERDLDPLRDRDVVVLTDTDPDAMSPARKQLRPRGFAMVLVAKDGAVSLRKPKPYTVRELTRVIDKMPDRQREVRERRTTP
jgi:hypothetical protein